MDARNTVRIPCLRLYWTGDTTFVHLPDDSIREFVVPRNSFIWEPPNPDIPPPAGFGDYETGVDLGVLWTHCAVNSNTGEETWYGFGTWEELKFFRLLMQADKVGPKTAFKVLDSNPWKQIYALIERGDREGFKKLKGMGPKIGAAIEPLVFSSRPPAPAGPAFNKDAKAGLECLGYPAARAKELVTAVQAQHPDADTAGIIKLALQVKR